MGTAMKGYYLLIVSHKCIFCKEKPTLPISLKMKFSDELSYLTTVLLSCIHSH